MKLQNSLGNHKINPGIERTLKILEIGNTIRIVNNYKSEYGIIGEVTRITKTRVWISDKNGNIHRRAPFNVEPLKYDLDQYQTRGDSKYFGGKGFQK